MAEYESNSQKSKKKAEKDKRNEKKAPVVKNKISVDKTGKKPAKKTSPFIEDIKMIGTTMWDEVIVPGILNLSSDLWHSMGDAAFESITGRSRPSGGRRYDSSYKSYDGYYKGDKKRRNRRDRDDDDDDRPRKKKCGRYSIYEIRFEDLGDAREVRHALLEQIDEFEFASVKDYYDFSQFEDWEYSDYPQDWGWDDLDPHLRIDETRDGKYVLRLPRPIPLD